MCGDRCGEHRPSPPRLSAWRFALVLAAAALPLASCSGQDKVPTGPEVIGRFVEATGGQAAYDAVQNRVTRYAVTFDGEGPTIRTTAYQARPNKLYSISEMDGGEKMEKGSTGDLAWENSAVAGPLVKEGAERTDALREATLDKLAHWKEIFSSAEYAGVEHVAGKAAHKVVLTPKEGPPQTVWFDKGSGLVVKWALALESPGGPISIVNYPSDFRKVGSVLVPHTVQVEVNGQKRVSRTESAEGNAPLPPDRFDPPAEVQDLVRGRGEPAPPGGDKKEPGRNHSR